MTGKKNPLLFLVAILTTHISLASVMPGIKIYCPADSVPVQQTNADTSIPQYYRLNGKYLASYWPSFKKAATSPLRWEDRDWRNAGIVLAAGGLLFTADLEIRNFVQRNRSPFATSISDVLEPLGNNYPPVIFTSLYLASVITKDRKLEHATLMTVKSFLISTAFYTLTKATIRRQRPLRADDQYEFAAPFSRNKLTSFPSGHSNTVFSIATAMAIEYKHKKWVPWICYSLATLTGLSRIYQDRHWASDVLFGAAIGHFVTRAIYAREKKKKQRLTGDPLSISATGNTARF